MSRRPVIGIPTQTLHVIDGIPEGLPASWVMNQRYYHAATAGGAVPWMIPLLHDDLATLREIYDRLDGVLVAGGVDMDPATYRTAPHPALGAIDPARDAVELQLTRWALEDGLPFFGICRGLHVINVACGGTLVQDIPGERPDALKHDYFPHEGHARDFLAHTVLLAPGTRLRDGLGGREEIMVNSMHHQAVDRLGAGLVASARSTDGLIEGLEAANGGYAVAVQWHPESMAPEHYLPLLRPFLAEAGRG